MTAPFHKLIENAGTVPKAGILPTACILVRMLDKQIKGDKC
jgi:hypothetical protein